MSFSDAIELALLDHLLGGPDYVRPATVYVGLSTTTPNDDGSGITEPAGGAYARVAVTNNATNWPAAAGGAKSNGTVIQFPQATATWGTVTHFVLFDADVGGTVLVTGALDTERTVQTGDQPAFAASVLVTTLS